MSTVISSSLILLVPLLLAAMGGLVHRASGIVNIGLEGQMLIGALLGAVISGATGSWALGMLAAGLTGAVSAWLMTLVITRLQANQIIVGLGFNILAAGVIGFVLTWQMGVSGTYRVPGLDRLPRYDIVWLDSIPVLGPVFNHKDLVFWLTLVLIPLLVWLLRSTRFGVRVRAAGDAEQAAASQGINVLSIRERAGAIAGALAGLGGAYLSVAQVGLFNDEMVAGRGFIALAAFYFGRARPVPTALACLVFAFFDALQVNLQSSSSTSQLLTTLPYLSVLIALAIAAYRDSIRREKVPSV